MCLLDVRMNVMMQFDALFVRRVKAYQEFGTLFLFLFRVCVNRLVFCDDGRGTNRT